MKCLLVDDEPGIREGLAALLRRRGHDVRTAGDCAAAAAAIAERTFDVVVTDWRLPDGRAAQFVVDCPCPVVAISGHPEEVEQHAIVHSVLAKPVTPSRLLEALDAARLTADTAPAARLPVDVQRVLDAANACLPAGAETSVHDDGTFVLWCARLVDDGPVHHLAELGGDLRVLGEAPHLRAELRLCRDGRPDSCVPAVRPHSAWPDCGEFAVDFDGSGLASDHFADCLERVLARTRRGQRVHLLNIPESCRAVASDWEKTNDVPMKARVGPRLPAVLIDLWSQP